MTMAMALPAGLLEPGVAPKPRSGQVVVNRFKIASHTRDLHRTRTKGGKFFLLSQNIAMEKPHGRRALKSVNDWPIRYGFKARRRGCNMTFAVLKGRVAHGPVQSPEFAGSGQWMIRRQWMMLGDMFKTRGSRPASMLLPGIGRSRRQPAPTLFQREAFPSRRASGGGRQQMQVGGGMQDGHGACQPMSPLAPGA